jgi:hypothetical protein
LHAPQRHRVTAQIGRLRGNQYLQRVLSPPQQAMAPNVVAASWTERGGEEWNRYDELRTLLERQVTAGETGERYRFEVLEEDRVGPTRWRITPPTRLEQELGEAAPQEVGRGRILQRLEAWVAREREAGRLPAGAGERQVPQPPGWMTEDARAFFEQVTRGQGIFPGEPDVRFFGPTITIELPYLAGGGAEEATRPPGQGVTRISTSSQVVWVHWIRGGPIHLQAFRFAPTERSDPFYAERDFALWQDWNYQMFRFVVQERMSIEQAYAHMHAIDMETIRQMLAYVAVSRV